MCSVKLARACRCADRLLGVASLVCLFADRLVCAAVLISAAVQKSEKVRTIICKEAAFHSVEDL